MERFFGERRVEKHRHSLSYLASAFANSKKRQAKSIFKEVYLQKRPPERRFILLSLLR